MITKRKRPIARLRPEPAAAKPAVPDFNARLKSIFGDRILKVTGADLVRRDRDRSA